MFGFIDSWMHPILQYPGLPIFDFFFTTIFRPSCTPLTPVSYVPLLSLPAACIVRDVNAAHTLMGARVAGKHFDQPSDHCLPASAQTRQHDWLSCTNHCICTLQLDLTQGNQKPSNTRYSQWVKILVDQQGNGVHSEMCSLLCAATSSLQYWFKGGMAAS